MFYFMDFTVEVNVFEGEEKHVCDIVYLVGDDVQWLL